jgi:hypothetical protein
MAGPEIRVHPAVGSFGFTGLFGSNIARYEWVGSGGLNPGGKLHTTIIESGRVTLVSGVNAMKPNGWMFAALTFSGLRRTLITAGRPAGSVSDRLNCRCATVLAAGMVTVAPSPGPTGPSVTEVDAVVLVVSVPAAVAGPEAVAPGVGDFGTGEIRFTGLLHAQTVAASTSETAAKRKNGPRNGICSIGPWYC